MKRKIAIISEHNSPLAALGGVENGGQCIYVGQIARHIASMGYEVDVFTRWDNPKLPEIVNWSDGVRVIHIKAGPKAPVRKEDLLPYMKEFTRHMLKHIAKMEKPYQLIHANFFMSALVAADIKKTLDIPFVVTFHALGKVRRIHQGDNDQFPTERLAIEERIVREADMIIAECPQDREDLITLYQADPERITTIPCGFDPHEFYPIDRLLARMVLEIDEADQVLLQLGRMVPRKGVDTVIESLPTLKKKYNLTPKLFIVGGESEDPDPKLCPELGRLKTIAKNLKVEDQVIFVGSRGREVLKYYYNAADIFISTPWYEPFGITPLEAMACGTPVIGSNVGGIKYSVMDGKTGFLVPPKDSRALAGKIAELLINEKTAAIFKENAIRRVNSQFTWSRVASAIASLYESILISELSEHGSAEQLAIINQGFETASEIMERSKQVLRIPILDASSAIVRSLSNGGKVFICGNGGSAADSQHFAGELMGRFIMQQRPGLPVISLTADTAFITAWSNDVSYDDIFARQIEALGKPEDVLIGISTSGNSANLIEAFKLANQRNISCIGILGKSGGKLLDYSDIAIVVPSDNTQRIQEVHLNVVHAICELVENQLFAKQSIQPRIRESVTSYSKNNFLQFPITQELKGGN